MIDASAVERFALLLIRTGMLVVAAPVFGGVWAPATLKVGVIVLVSLLLMPVVPLPAASGPGGIGMVAAREALIGFSLALGLRALVAGAEFAGHLAGFQIGFAYASLVDPQTGARNNLLSLVYGTLTVVTVFTTDAHHDLLRALALSYDALPVGSGATGASVPEVVAELLGVVFRVGLQLAAPVVVVLLIVEVALGLLTRAAPTLNLMAQGFPIRIAVGLLALAATLRAIPSVVRVALPQIVELGARTAQAFR
jgi:flagellar biosynthetic protein FliR